MPKKSNGLIAVTELQARLGLSREGVRYRLKAAKVEVITEPFGPGLKSFIRATDLRKVLKPARKTGGQPGNKGGWSVYNKRKKAEKRRRRESVDAGQAGG